MNSAKIKRILMSMCGVIICAVSVAVFKIAALGADPFQSLMAGVTVATIPTMAGSGTIITAFFIGSLIELFNVRVARPLLKKM